MPTYDYRCPEGHTFERFHRMSEQPLAECPTCGTRAERILSAGAGFLFKGEGFYITDYRSESYRKAAEAEKSAATGKPDAKAGSKEPVDSGSGGSKESSSADGTSQAAASSADSNAGASTNPAKSANGAN